MPMDAFLNQLSDLIAAQDLTVAEVLGALEIMKFELLTADDDDGDDGDDGEACSVAA